jgi:hypothetical protein
MCPSVGETLFSCESHRHCALDRTGFPPFLFFLRAIYFLTLRDGIPGVTALIRLPRFPVITCVLILKRLNTLLQIVPLGHTQINGLSIEGASSGALSVLTFRWEFLDCCSPPCAANGSIAAALAVFRANSISATCWVLMGPHFHPLGVSNPPASLSIA